MHARQLRLQVSPETRVLLEQFPHCYHHDLLCLQCSEQRLYVVPQPCSETLVQVPLHPHAFKKLESTRSLYALLQKQRLPKARALLSEPKRAHLIRCLRALDGHCQHLSYRQIAVELHHLPDAKLEGWKTHDLRSAIIRLVKGGLKTSLSGYKHYLSM